MSTPETPKQSRGPKITRVKAVAELETQAGDVSRLYEKPITQWRLAMRRFRGRKSGMVGLSIVVALIMVAIFAPVLAPYDPVRVLIGQEDIGRYDPPCIHVLNCPEDQPQHIMGIDGNVRDEFSRVIFGSRISLTLGFFTVTLALLVGSAIGAIAGFQGGWLDNVMMRFMDVILGFPSLLLAIAIVAVLGPGLENALLAIAIVTMPGYARVMRGSRRLSQADPLPPGHPQCPDSPRGSGNPGCRHGDPRGGRSVLPRARRPASHPGVGIHARLRAEPGLHRPPPGVLSRSGDHGHRPRVQPDG
jgi:hypothetical protein